MYSSGIVFGVTLLESSVGCMGSSAAIGYRFVPKSSPKEIGKNT